MESLITINTENLTSAILSGNSTTFTDILTTSDGFRAMQHFIGFNNQTIVDKIPADMMHLIDPHWLFFIFLLINISVSFCFCKINLMELLNYRYQFPPIDPMWHKILGLVMIVLGFMGWIGNGVIVYIFLMTSSLRTPSNLLIVNLAFSDFIMMIIMTPPMVINCYYETWILGNANVIFFYYTNIFLKFIVLYLMYI